ncbi:MULTISPECIES: murein hydrolase activator EnvC family protein [unclassified Agarivorans]|uniref:murein hydrolase activator EnvC family protein n=1 Tax=unclassified Agarivorans TaxID=2636026 RepID=UPI0026E19CEA|nr:MULTISPECIES: peptidoglycan DD-metalloendopeptidase family protein [unclassified Agarivorans]MDO6687471.1 peptidoglycan DD-metalloendopeptidase family protein [Agarivorans sp. 3_MG-2023]MDO6715237.1 peptidoglycan DD-metalloendopeptidase family protein [Agarivorans sp. 2_MG-2023]
MKQPNSHSNQGVIKRLVRLLNASLIAGVLLLLCSPTHADEQQQLINVQKQLKQQQQQLKQRKSNISKAQEQLRQYELALADSSQQLRKLNNQLSHSKMEQLQIESQINTLEQQLKQQQKALAAQINSAYRLGESDYMKMLLNQQNAANLERMLSYYQYLAKARSAALLEVNDKQIELSQVQEQLAESQKKLEALVNLQQDKLQQSQAQQNQRKQQLAKLNTLQNTEQSRLEQLQINEQQLQQVISDKIEQQQQLALKQNLDKTPLTGLAKTKGKLPWPLSGRVLHSYNSQNQGQTRWQGIVIDSHPGTKVQAVAAGNVVFADWLRGYGLVVAIDHGEQYLSFYGYNQSINAEVGERVNAGKTIAYAGNTGGQTTNALFFQIRHKGQTQDPSKWLK